MIEEHNARNLKRNPPTTGDPADLLRVERLAAAEEFAGEVAHAINNPLAALMGRLQMRIERLSPPDAEDEALLKLARRIDRTVAGMLELSNRSALHPTETRLVSILEEALKSVRVAAKEAGVKFESYADPRAETVFADPVLLTRALQVLLANAVDALPNGGTVRIEAEEVRQAGALLLRVQDPGSGMNPEIAELATEPFFTTKPGHTGLGMTLAQRIATAHGGRLRVKSAEHMGTVVTLELPTRRSAASA